MRFWITMAAAFVLSAAAASAQTVLQVSSQIAFENFEGAAVFENVNTIAEADGNHAMYLYDERSDVVFCPPNNAVIEGRFKVSETFGRQSSFEIIPKSSPKGDSYFGGGRYNICAVDLKRGFVQVGSSIGDDVELSDGWNSFRVTYIGRNVCLEVNGTMHCAELAQMKSGLMFRAQGCGVLIDDVRVSQPASGGATYSSLAAVKTIHKVSPYVPYNFLEGAGLVRMYSNGTRVNDVNTGDVTYEVIGDYKELARGCGYFYSDAQIQFTYNGKSCTVSVISDSDGMTKGEYLRESVYKRRQKLALTAYESLNMDGYKKSTAGYSRLVELLSAAYLYPTCENHDEIIDFFLTMAENTVFETRGSVGAEDFIALDLMLLSADEGFNISDGLRQSLKRYFLGLNFSEPSEELSENHRITYYAIGIAAFEAYPDEVFFNRLGAEENREIYKKYILDWIDFRMKYGMGEYDSAQYYSVDFAALETIYTVTKDRQLKRRVNEMLMYLYTDAALDSNNGVMGGAQCRLYVNTKTQSEIFPLNIYFGDRKNTTMGYTMQMLPMCFSEFAVQESLAQMRADPRQTYTNIERRRIYTIPDDEQLCGSVTKYTYVTPEYIIGSLVQSDNLPPQSYKKGDKYYVDTGTFANPTRVLPDFQSIGFSMNFLANPMLNVIDSHPGGGYSTLSGAHSYFSGDHGCHCARYAQKEHTVLGIRNIPSTAAVQFSHFYINREAFDEILEKDGWIFLRSGDVYGALLPLCENGVYEWGSSDELFDKTPLSQLEIKLNSNKSAFAAEIYSKSEIGSFEDFVNRVCKTQIEYKNNCIVYQNLAKDVLCLEYDTGKFYVNSVLLDYTGEYSDSSSGYIQSLWGNGRIEYEKFATLCNSYANVYKTGARQYKVTPMHSEGRLFAAVYDKNGFLESVCEYEGEEAFELSGGRVKAIVIDDVTMKPEIRQSY